MNEETNTNSMEVNDELTYLAGAHDMHIGDDMGHSASELMGTSTISFLTNYKVIK